MPYADDQLDSLAERAMTTEHLQPRDEALVYAISALAYAVKGAGERLAEGLSAISLELMQTPTKRG